MERTTWWTPARQRVFAVVAIVAALIWLGYQRGYAAGAASSTQVTCADGADLLVHPGGGWSCGAAPTPTPSPNASASPSPSASSSPSPSPTPTTTPTNTPSPTPSATATSTPTPNGCPVAGTGVPGARDLWGGCFPGPGNTGVPSGTVLHACSSTLAANTTYDSCSFTGGIQIRVAGVRITRSLIRGQVTALSDDYRGLIISDSTIQCGCFSNGSNGTPSSLMGSYFTLLRVDLSGSGHGIAPETGVTVRDTWIHGLGGGDEAHKNGAYVGDGSNTVLRHNSIACDAAGNGCTSAIGLLSDFGVINHWQIDHNLLNSRGSFCFYGGYGASSGKPYNANNIVFTDNVFGRALYPKCGFYGPVTDFQVTAPGNVWARNVWVDGGAVLPA